MKLRVSSDYGISSEPGSEILGVQARQAKLLRHAYGCTSNAPTSHRPGHVFSEITSHPTSPQLPALSESPSGQQIQPSSPYDAATSSSVLVSTTNEISGFSVNSSMYRRSLSYSMIVYSSIDPLPKGPNPGSPWDAQQKHSKLVVNVS
jgi:hypothetical protein